MDIDKVKFQKDKPLIILSSVINAQGLLDEGFSIVEISQEPKDVIMKIFTYEDLNLVIDSNEVYNKFKSSKEVEDFLTICLNAGYCRLIYIIEAIKVKEDKIIKFLFRNRKFDIVVANSEDNAVGYSITKVLIDALIKVKKATDFKKIITELGYDINNLNPNSNNDSNDNTGNISFTKENTEGSSKGLLGIDNQAKYVLDSKRFNGFADKYIGYLDLLEEILNRDNATTLMNFMMREKIELINLKDFVKDKNKLSGDLKEQLENKNNKIEELIKRLNKSKEDTEKADKYVSDLSLELLSYKEKLIENIKYSEQLEKSLETLNKKLSKGDINGNEVFSLKTSEYETFERIIYFKEITKPEYFNTFIKMTAENLNSNGYKTGVFVFENSNVYLNKKRALTGNLQIINSASKEGNYRFEGNIVILNIINRGILRCILENKNKYDLILVIDSLHRNFEFLTGWNTSILYTAKRYSDIDLLGIPSDKIIANDYDKAFIKLRFFERYRELSPLLRQKYYNKIIDKFKAFIKEK